MIVLCESRVARRVETVEKAGQWEGLVYFLPRRAKQCTAEMSGLGNGSGGRGVKSSVF